ncbi:initiation control protein YabA [Companilactobacillus sp. DQM5]|uniref:initiation control protein YabA n=1 Tax=Companilactobacillus sp. DQM5 TaxID=3463359 RepID=UPI004059AA6C
MVQKDYFQEFEKLLAQAKDLNAKIKDMQEGLSSILVENAELKIENDNLRNKLNNKNSAKANDDVSQAHQNLEKLYSQGYHVCTPMYGSHRKDNEECAFCLGIIYGRSDNKSKVN